MTFYIDVKKCRRCAHVLRYAKDNIKKDEYGNYIIAKQPKTEEEVKRLLKACERCPFRAIKAKCDECEVFNDKKFLEVNYD